MEENLVAKASITIDVPLPAVWNALTNPKAIRLYMFGAEVDSDWREGSPITWKGTWEGKSYVDKGVVVQVRPMELLQYRHYSPRSGRSDEPANYHTVTIELTGTDNKTEVLLTQDNNDTEEARRHAEENWEAMLTALRDVVTGH